MKYLLIIPNTVEMTTKMPSPYTSIWGLLPKKRSSYCNCV